MILIGQFDSPFVRRVGVALRLWELPFEHRPLSTFRDAWRVAEYNPLLRVPVLVLDSGETLIESSAILDHLDEAVGIERAMLAAEGAPRRTALRICAFATGLADKAVSLVYEQVLHNDVSDTWVARCRGQMESVLNILEADRQARHTTYWFGGRIGHADIAVACALRFMAEAHPVYFDLEKYPALLAHSALCEALPAFSETRQPFQPPAE
jgi:glutathione S-transferase